MQYAQINPDGTYSHQITTPNDIFWDENNFCSAKALLADGKAQQFHIVELYETDPPAFDPKTQLVVRAGAEFVNNRWQYCWQVNLLTVDQIALNNSQQAESVRSIRNTKLKDCDWTQLDDSTANKSAWAAYRQALRDISSQADFPWAVTWPLNPNELKYDNTI
jgi:hypothetical protein